jgi:hypothetical protein
VPTRQTFPKEIHGCSGRTTYLTSVTDGEIRDTPVMPSQHVELVKDQRVFSTQHVELVKDQRVFSTTQGNMFQGIISIKFIRGLK